MRVWGLKYAVKHEEGYIHLGMIRGLDIRAGSRLAELILANGLISPNAQLIDLNPDIESRERFMHIKKKLGYYDRTSNSDNNR